MKRFAAYTPYFLLTAAVMLPLLMPGYILTLDLVFTPELRMPDEISSNYPWLALLHFLNIFIPSQLIEKAILVSIPLLAGIGMHLLVEAIFNAFQKPLARGKRTFEPQVSKASLPAPLRLSLWPISNIATYSAGIFYAVNPFTYSRFMAGQYAVLLGYALLPWFALALLKFYEKPNYRTMLRLAGIVLLVSVISIHTVGELMLISLAGVGLALWHRDKNVRAYLRLGAIGAVLVLAASSYWLIPAAFGTGEEPRAVQTFDKSHAEAFATVGAGALGRVVNILDLQGFWAEGKDLFTLPQDRLLGWGTIRLLLWILIGIGVAACWRTQRRLAIVLGCLAIIAVTLAAGFPQEILTAAGYREPHKFTGLVAFVFAIFLAFGAAQLLGKARRHSELRYGVTGAAIMLVVILFTPTMYWGFGGQLKPRQYPAGWADINTRLNRDKDHFETLFLPWHQYMSFDFSGRIIGNPAPAFFDKPLITSHDPELGNIQPKLSAQEKAVDRILQDPADDLPEQIAMQNIKYVILAKNHEYNRFSYLSSQKALRILTDTPGATLYLNTSYKENR